MSRHSTSDTHETRPHSGMTLPGLVLAHIAILGIIAFSAWDIVRGGEHWPFSSYPMFSETRTLSSGTSQLRLYGVTVEGGERLIEGDQLRPFDRNRLSLALARLSRTDGDRLEEAMRDVWLRCERDRVAGKHSGPAIVGIRLYSDHLSLDPRLEGWKEPRSRSLILEIGDQD